MLSLFGLFSDFSRYIKPLLIAILFCGLCGMIFVGLLSEGVPGSSSPAFFNTSPKNWLENVWSMFTSWF